jgi:hypothetical protein
MRNNTWRFVMWSLALAGAGFLLGRMTDPAPVLHAQSAGRVFELRTYTAPDGKIGDLHARFSNHTMRIFEKHGMSNVAYFSPHDTAQAQTTLVYLISHASREAAAQNWKNFSADPEWQKVSAESQVNGRIVTKIDSLFLVPTSYSPIK